MNINKNILIYCVLIGLRLQADGLTQIAAEYTTLAQESQKKGNSTQAINYFNQALRLDPNNLQTRFFLANAYVNTKQKEKAIAQYQTILASNPQIPPVLYNLAYTYRTAGNFSKAVETYQQVLALQPENADAKQGLAHAQLALGDYEQAWENFEHRWTRPRADSRTFATFMHSRGSLHGKTVLIRSEFGLGDTFQFIRYGKELKDRGARVIAQVQKPLIQILSLCPYLDHVIGDGDETPSTDFSTVLMSLPWAFKTTIKSIPNTVPYLFAPESLVKTWQEKLAHDRALKIGICWNGNAYNTKNLQDLVAEKSIPLNLLAELSDIPGLSFYSLQKISGLDQLNNLGKNFTLKTFEDLDEKNGRFMDTAALIKNMDLVITIDTSIAHLAGGLGVPVFLLLPHTADWRWLVDQDDTPWYPTMRLFRQKKQGDWPSCIESVKKAVLQLLEKKKPVESVNDLLIKGFQAYKDGDLQKSLDCYTKALESYPNQPLLLYNTGVACRKLNKLSQAAQHFEKLLSIDSQHGDAYFGLAQTYLGLGMVQKGWEIFNNYRPTALKACPAINNLSGKTVLIRAEWGLGDMIWLIRYTTLLKNCGAQVIVEAHTPLVPLLNLCSTIDQVIPFNTPLPKRDYDIPLFCLPTIFKTSESSIPSAVPYLRADSQKIAAWGARLGSKKSFKIGICWDVGHHDTNIPAWQRTVPLAAWRWLSELPQVELYCLQKVTDVAATRTQLPALKMFDETFDRVSFMDTAAVMEHLDLIISVDTSVAHLAGALAAPVWTLLPYSPDYRWTLTGNTTPWYPTMRLFRQQKPGDWTAVMDELRESLTACIAAKMNNHTNS